jgi:hypothetical protein
MTVEGADIVMQSSGRTHVSLSEQTLPLETGKLGLHGNSG